MSTNEQLLLERQDNSRQIPLVQKARKSIPNADIAITSSIFDITGKGRDSGQQFSGEEHMQNEDEEEEEEEEDETEQEALKVKERTIIPAHECTFPRFLAKTRKQMYLSGGNIYTQSP